MLNKKNVFPLPLAQSNAVNLVATSRVFIHEKFQKSPISGYGEAQK